MDEANKKKIDTTLITFFPCKIYDTNKRIIAIYERNKLSFLFVQIDVGTTLFSK